MLVLRACQLCLTLRDPWTIPHQAPLSMGSSRQEYWSGLPFPSPRDLPNPGVKPTSPVALHWQADALPLSHVGSPFVSLVYHYKHTWYKYLSERYGDLGLLNCNVYWIKSIQSLTDWILLFSSYFKVCCKSYFSGFGVQVITAGGSQGAGNTG